MATKERKIEVYRLTISGLPEGLAYNSFLLSLRGENRPIAQMVMKSGEKWHAIVDVVIRNHRLKLRFMSYTKGHRPDILDTDRFSLQPNPLTPTQTGVEWTHVLGNSLNGRYLLLIERNQGGIWPSTLETYFQWMIDKFYETEISVAKEDNNPVCVSLEAEPGPEFLARVNGLDKITEASVRVVRPNPGWRDLDTELGVVAEQSDAHKAEIIMKARKRSVLDRHKGILDWIKSKFAAKELDYAAVKGQRGDRRDSFNTKQLAKREVIKMEIDERGQVIAEDAWNKMSKMMGDLD